MLTTVTKSIKNDNDYNNANDNVNGKHNDNNIKDDVITIYS